MKRFVKSILSLTIAIAIVLMWSPAKISLADTLGMTGSGTPADPYIVVTAQQLNSLHSLPLTSCFRLGNNIDCTSIGYPIPLGNIGAPYSGTFDGAGYTISHVSYNLTGDMIWFGLISFGQGATIKDLTVNGTVSGGTLYGTANQFGAIAAYLNGSTVINCNANITVTTGSAIGTLGGLVGTLSNGSITNGSTTLTVTSATGQSNTYPFTIGGLCGQANNSQISNCSSSTNINITGIGGVYAGGLCGYADADTTGKSISNCHSNAIITEHNNTISEGYTGGLIGYISASNNVYTIDKCYSDGNISGTDAVGGLIGYTTSSSGTPITITNSYSDVNVASSYMLDDYAGGFIGYNVAACAKNCYSLGSITFNIANVPSNHSTFAGGFAGHNGAYLYNCYSTGSLTVIGTKASWDYVGAFVGSGGNGSYCYFNATTIPDLLGVIGGNDYTIGISTTQMTNNQFLLSLNSNISGFTDCVPWSQSEAINYGYPFLNGVGVGCDTTAPDGNYSLSKTIWTCNPLTITVTAIDTQSGVASIACPDGKVVSGSTASYLVTANGTYNFVLTDNDGNSGILSVVVTNIDKSVNVTHTLSTAYTFDPNTNNLNIPDTVIQNNNSHIGLDVQIKWNPSSGIIDEPSNYTPNWDLLNMFNTMHYLSIGVHVNTLYSAGWASIQTTQDIPSSNQLSFTDLGTLLPSGSGDLAYSINAGLAWAAPKTVIQGYSLEFSAKDAA